MLDALALGCEALAAVEPVDGAVERLMRSAEVWRHQVRIVQIGQCSVRVRGAGVEHGVGERL